MEISIALAGGLIVLSASMTDKQTGIILTLMGAGLLLSGLVILNNAKN